MLIARLITFPSFVERPMRPFMISIATNVPGLFADPAMYATIADIDEVLTSNAIEPPLRPAICPSKLSASKNAPLSTKLTA